MFAPLWPDAAFFRKLDELVRGYKYGYATMRKEKLSYDHVSGGHPAVKSVVFVFVGNSCSLGEAREFVHACGEVMAESVVGRGGGGGGRTVPESAMVDLLHRVRERRAHGRGRGGGGGGKREFESIFTDTLERVVNFVSDSNTPL